MLQPIMLREKVTFLYNGWLKKYLTDLKNSFVYRKLYVLWVNGQYFIFVKHMHVKIYKKFQYQQLIPLLGYQVWVDLISKHPILGWLGRFPSRWSSAVTIYIYIYLLMQSQGGLLVCNIFSGVKLLTERSWLSYSIIGSCRCNTSHNISPSSRYVFVI